MTRRGPRASSLALQAFPGYAIPGAHQPGGPISARTPLLALVVALTALAAPLDAQRDSREPRRPKLDGKADPNDAEAYYAHALTEKIGWEQAYAGFYWAYRLDPEQPGYLYGQWYTLWRRQSLAWRRDYRQGVEYVVKSKEAARLDSLYAEVLLRDPFSHLYSGFCYIPDQIEEVRDPLTAALLWAEGYCHEEAAQKYGEALAKTPQLLSLHVDHARHLYFTGEYREAIGTLQTLLDSLRQRDATELLHIYESKEMFEYMIAICHLQMRDNDAARAALGRALTENLAFAMAHAKLGSVALAQGDVKTATLEYDLAVQLRGDDGLLRYGYGVALFRARRYDDAAEQFRKAIEGNPYFASAYFNLAAALDNLGKGAEALAYYEQYVAKAPRRLKDRIATAERRIAALTQP